VSRSRVILLACVLIMASLWIGLFLPSDSLSDSLLRPWRMLWGSSLQLNATLLEVSGADTVRSVSRPLQKPFGPVKLLREVETKSKAKT
jgi:hypothetical protein